MAATAATGVMAVDTCVCAFLSASSYRLSLLATGIAASKKEKKTILLKGIRELAASLPHDRRLTHTAAAHSRSTVFARCHQCVRPSNTRFHGTAPPVRGLVPTAPFMKFLVNVIEPLG